MIKVFTAPALPEVELLRSVLENANIGCVVRNEYLTIPRGDLPFTDTWPELWVLDDRDRAQAEVIIAQAQTGDESATAQWICPGCGEAIDGQFSSCWNCETERPATE